MLNMNSEDSSIDIVDASEEDAGEILEIQKLAFHGQGVLYNDLLLPPLVQTLEELVWDFRTYAFLKALSDGKIVGSVRGRCESDTCQISRLIVHPGYQNRGLGKKLMHAIESKFNSMSRYELFTGDKSEKNLAMYGMLGYREFARKPQSVNVTLICLEKRKA
jgi:N-acetylglutamate synthase-like GNAT family acetyltransferase